MAALVCFVAGTSRGQFLRLGPFDFSGIAKVEGIYTTNVEQERASDAKRDREDYFLRYGVKFPGRAEVSPFTTLDAEFGLSYEKHFVREDLDNTASPFMSGRLGAVTKLPTLTLHADVRYDRTEDEAPGASGTALSYVPGGRKKRQISTTTSYGAGAEWKRNSVELSYGYHMDQERFDDAEFQDGDSDDTTQNFEARYLINSRWSAAYSLEATRNVLVNDPNANREWKNTERIDITGNLDVWRHPHMTYSFGMEKEDEQDKEGEWDFIHTLSADDEYNFSPALQFKGFATYEYEDHPEENDISLTYGVRLFHELGRTARQSFGVTREPVSTFGSTQDTDSTDWGYDFTKSDLFIYNLDLLLRVNYMIDKPLDNSIPEERTWEYGLTLRHKVEISRRLRRTLMYEFTREDSDLQTELLDEHRVTLGFEYDL